jgi:hypothetical protein
MHQLRWGSVGLLLIACASSAPKPAKPAPAVTVAETPPPALPVRKRGGDKLIVEVGSAGGTLELDNGARLEIPQGALNEPVEITFAQGTKTTAFSNREYERPVGPTLDLAPPVALAVPAKVSVPVQSLPEGFSEADLALGLEVLSEEQRAVQMHGTQTRWDYFPAVSASGRAVAELSSFPGFRLQFVVSKNE